jgi:hypothetical protein
MTAVKAVRGADERTSGGVDGRLVTAFALVRLNWWPMTFAIDRAGLGVLYRSQAERLLVFFARRARRRQPPVHASRSAAEPAAAPDGAPVRMISVNRG